MTLYSSTIEEATTEGTTGTPSERNKSRKDTQQMKRKLKLNHKKNANGKNKNKNKIKNKIKDKDKEKTRTRTYKDIKEFKQAKETFATASVSSARKQTNHAGNDNVKVNAGANARSTESKNNSKNNSQHTESNTDSAREVATNANTDTHTNADPNKNIDANSDTARDHAQQQMKKRIRNIHNIRSSRTSEEVKRSSLRMDKAQLLLEDLSSDATMQDLEAKPSSPSSVDSTIPPENADASTAAATVPDAFWYNGNLQRGQGDYVTRWAQGVKVAEPLRKYDPLATEKLLFLQPAKWIVRNVQIAIPLSLWAIGVATDVVTNQEESNRKNRAKQLLNTISGLGPAIIKGGQALASRSDLMPSEYLDQLQKLQDDVPRFANELALATVEEELEVDFDDVFELMDPEPIAAASIGQVYKARLRSNGDLVALKIQRPKCEEIIALDLYVLRWWSGVANVLTKLLNRDINVQSIIDDFGELIYRELDYVAEAANAQRFSELYAGQVKDVFVPKVYSDLTTSKVLTMEWVEGFRLTDSEKLDEYGLDGKKLVDTLVQCSLRQILGNGFFHADPHAGNLLVVPDGRLCYLDFGMMSYAASEQRNGFLLAVVHMVNRDWDELVQMYQRLGFIPEGTNLKPIAVALENSLPDALNADISELNFKNVVGKLGDIMYTYPFSLPPFYISIIRCLGVLEGLAIQVDPQARIISEAYPYVASRVLTDPQDELQEALRRLALTSDGHIRWDRLETLLSKAKGSSDYDSIAAVTQLTNYFISENGEQLLVDLADEIVDGADSLGIETVGYVIEAARAFAINDEVAAARALTTLQEIASAAVGGDNGPEKIRETLSGVLPEPTPAMLQFWRISMLLGARGSGSDPAKLIPLVRKLSQEPKIQTVAKEVVARLGERVLSRSLRALFGLSQPEKAEARSPSA